MDGFDEKDIGFLQHIWSGKYKICISMVPNKEFPEWVGSTDWTSAEIVVSDVVFLGGTKLLYKI